MKKNKRLDMDVVNNFISTLDRKSSKTWHMTNASCDANLYNWSDETLGKIFYKLDEIYGELT